MTVMFSVGLLAVYVIGLNRQSHMYISSEEIVNPRKGYAGHIVKCVYSMDRGGLCYKALRGVSDRVLM